MRFASKGHGFACERRTRTAFAISVPDLNQMKADFCQEALDANTSDWIVMPRGETGLFLHFHLIERIVGILVCENVVAKE